ncbi:MAG: choice-of-anchor A family protein [Phenylobacterium sp.]|nr:choice-of-anchor A family protein [Phenylobacterium sp.]
MAVGGDATLSPYTIGQSAPAGGINLVVGGDLVSTNGGNVFNGGIMVGGSTTGVQAYQQSQIVPGALPVDFTDEQARLYSLTDYLKGLADTGAISIVNYGVHNTQITLTGSNAGLNVFNLDAADVNDAGTINLNLTNGGYAIINVVGTGSISFYNGSLHVTGGNERNVLWNLPGITGLSVASWGGSGSILAPYANYNPVGYGNINGQLIVANFSGSYAAATQINNYKFVGGELGMLFSGFAVPEPATWALMIGGFGLAGAALRRRRALAA